MVGNQDLKSFVHHKLCYHIKLHKDHRKPTKPELRLVPGPNE